MIPDRCGLSSLHSEHAATRGLLATDHVILNHGQVTWTTPELAPPLLTTTPHQREDNSVAKEPMRFKAPEYATLTQNTRHEEMSRSGGTSGLKPPLLESKQV
ncbi:hypothetical protein TNCV_431121 [Trichonephila clavipes]|nr:hypothetical protein TNCV_431121 [Trichonephila clavipes]